MAIPRLDTIFFIFYTFYRPITRNVFKLHAEETKIFRSILTV